MDIWIISNLLAILNNAVVRILERISLCLCLSISVGFKPRRWLLGQRICISSTLLKSLQSEWISIVYLAMYESSCIPHSYQHLGLSTFSFLSNWWVWCLIMMLTLIFLITSKVYHHITCLLASQVCPSMEFFYIPCPCFCVVVYFL